MPAIFRTPPPARLRFSIRINGMATWWGWATHFPTRFNSVGTFNYVDQLDLGTGSVIVSPTSAPPAINLVSPRLTGGQFLFDATGLTMGENERVAVLDGPDDLAVH